MNDITPAVTGSRAIATPLNWLRSEIDRLFDDFYRPARDLALTGGTLPVPAIEMVERDKDYCLTAELPGMKDDDVKITVADRALVIAGEKREDEERKEGGFMLRERRYGSFERRIPLPATVDEDAIEADFSKGVLTVTLPKSKDAAERVRRIDIRKD